jgi:hypothetical protein
MPTTKPRWNRDVNRECGTEYGWFGKDDFMAGGQDSFCCSGGFLYFHIEMFLC